MQAIMEHETMNQIEPIVTVTYNEESKLITATTFASWDSAESKLTVDVPVIAVPGSGTEGIPVVWKIRWILHYDPATLDWASFNADGQGIVIPAPNTPLPLRVRFLTSEQGESLEQWEVTIENSAHSVISFKYDMALRFFPKSAGAPTDPVGPRLKTIHDPTIVVTPDPIDS